MAWSSAKLVTISRGKEAERAALEKKIEVIETENHSLRNDIDQLQRSIEESNKQFEETKKQLELAKQAKARTSTTKYASATINDSNVCVIAAKKYFPQSEWENAKLVIQRESGGNPNAVSKTNDHGCFQLNKGLQNFGQIVYDPDFNAQRASMMFAQRKWRPWYAVRGILWS